MIDIRASWDGDVLVPTQRFIKSCNSELVVGTVYDIAVGEQRSMEAHKSYMAYVNDVFDNLPEDSKFKSPDKLRKHALVQTGWADEKSSVWPTDEIAQNVAEAMMAALPDEAVVEISGNVVKVFTPRSQKLRGDGAMSAEDFKRSSEDVRNYLSKMIGVSQVQIAKNAGR